MEHLERELNLKPLGDNIDYFDACFQDYKDIIKDGSLCCNYIAMIEIDARKFNTNRQHSKSYFIIHGDNFRQSLCEFLQTDESSGLIDGNLFYSDCVKIIHETHI